MYLWNENTFFAELVSFKKKTSDLPTEYLERDSLF